MPLRISRRKGGTFQAFSRGRSGRWAGDPVGLAVRKHEIDRNRINKNEIGLDGSQAETCDENGTWGENPPRTGHCDAIIFDD